MDAACISLYDYMSTMMLGYLIWLQILGQTAMVVTGNQEVKNNDKHLRREKKNTLC